MQTDDRRILSEERVMRLIARQFPELAHLPVTRVSLSGWDNQTFHLGTKYLVRLPSALRYVPQVQKEQAWLPMLAPHLPVRIPKPVHQGEPDEDYLWSWSIYEWIPGQTASFLHVQMNLERFIEQLSNTLRSLHTLTTPQGPEPGPHSFFRGGDVQVYEGEVAESIEVLEHRIDVERVKEVWHLGLAHPFEGEPGWVHGDVTPANMLLDDENDLHALIDFGSSAFGDPACDLQMTWTFFPESHERAFIEAMVHIDEGTWYRARAWTLWKTLLLFATQERLKPNAPQREYENILERLYDV